MKRCFFAGMLFVLLGQAVQAQIRMGVRLTPSISYWTERLSSDSLRNYEGRSDFLPSAALFMEFKSTARYRVFASLGYQARRIRFNVEHTQPEGGITTHLERESMQFLTAGIGLKLLTDEFFTSTRFYIGIEPNLAVRIAHTTEHESTSGRNAAFTDRPQGVDITIRLSLGAEYDIGVQTTLFTGLLYERGFFDGVTDWKNTFPEDAFLGLRYNRFGLVLGVKF